MLQWVTNTYNPQDKDFEQYTESDYSQAYQGDELREAIASHIKWLGRKNLIFGEPKTLAGYTVAQLKEKKLVGVYIEV